MLKVDRAYKCNGCGKIYKKDDDAFNCCGPEEVYAVKHPRWGGFVEKSEGEILCLQCRHKDPEGHRFPPCPELHFSCALYAECDKYELAER